MKLLSLSNFKDIMDPPYVYFVRSFFDSTTKYFSINTVMSVSKNGYFLNVPPCPYADEIYEWSLTLYGTDYERKKIVVLLEIPN